jgi:hypothetical protein
MLVQCGLFWYILYQADACCIILSVSVSCWCHTYPDRYRYILTLTNDVIAHIACTGWCWYAVDFCGLYCIRMMLVASNFVFVSCWCHTYADRYRYILMLTNDVTAYLTCIGWCWYAVTFSGLYCIKMMLVASNWVCLYHVDGDRYILMLTNDVIAHIACTGWCWYAVDFSGPYCIRMMLVASHWMCLYHVDARLMLIEIYLCSLMMLFLT